MSLKKKDRVLSFGDLRSNEFDLYGQLMRSGWRQGHNMAFPYTLELQLLALYELL